METNIIIEEEDQVNEIVLSPSSYDNLCSYKLNVDKSLLIKEFIEASSDQILITRWRRTGKTMNMKMLRSFFQIITDKHGKQKTESTYSLFFDRAVYKTDSVDIQAIMMILFSDNEINSKNDEKLYEIYKHLISHKYPQLSTMESFPQSYNNIIKYLKESRQFILKEFFDSEDSFLQKYKVQDKKSLQSDIESQIEIWRVEQKRKYQMILFKFGHTFKHFSQYPVIFITFNKIDLLSFEKQIATDISQAYQDHEYMEYILQEQMKNNNDELVQKNAQENYQTFRQYKNKTSNDLESSIKFLSDILYRQFKRKVIVLIDEYDSPIMSVINKGQFKNVASKLSGIFKQGLKDSEFVQKVIFTGVTRISKQTLFSDLNNIKEYSVLDNTFSQYFGFTQKEVEKLLTQYNSVRSDIKQHIELKNMAYWYNGYIIGNNIIYNTFSVMNCLVDSKANKIPTFKTYWIESGSLDEIKDMYEILQNKKNYKDNLNFFLEKQIEFKPDQHITKDHLHSPTEVQFFSFLLHMGYLTRVKPDENIFKIPNNEVKQYFIDIILPRYIKKKYDIHFVTKDWLSIAKSIDNSDEFQSCLQSYLDKISPDANMKERDFQSILYTIFQAFPDLQYNSFQEVSNKQKKKSDQSFYPKHPNNIQITHQYKVTKFSKIQDKIEHGLWQACCNLYLSKSVEQSKELKNQHWKFFLLRVIVFYKSEIDQKWNVKIEEYKFCRKQTEQLINIFQQKEKDIKGNVKLVDYYQSMIEGNNKEHLRKEFLKNQPIKCDSIQQLLMNLQELSTQ